MDARLTPSALAIAATVYCLEAYISRASRILGSVITAGRPPVRPRARAAASPALVRSRIRSRSNSARAAKMWNTSLPPGVVVSMVERTSRSVVLVALPAGWRANQVRPALTTAMGRLPEQLRRSLTWDQGKEMAEHARLTADTGIPVFFCDPRSPWQRASNENANGLVRGGLNQSTHHTVVRQRQRLGWPAGAGDGAVDGRLLDGVSGAVLEPDESAHGIRWTGLGAVLAPRRALSSQTLTSRSRSATAGRQVRARESTPEAVHAATGTQVALRPRSRLSARQPVLP
jgi:hypothetical protein